MYMAGIHHVVRYAVQVLQATYQWMRRTYQCRTGNGKWSWWGRGLYPRKHLVFPACIGCFVSMYIYVRAPYVLLTAQARQTCGTFCVTIV
ncbi:hypothetical protein E2C01_054416 [Portunus trituberculatus]|uniref:Uncharacterized protein n=1 Tax=Portunus trituberculatus TaxID=210409 RepID=A0A5B7GNM2_PORTR|nr:hypothetical protein [Portunus trituberculatus]